jgi:hypothetical protein
MLYAYPENCTLLSFAAPFYACHRMWRGSRFRWQLHSLVACFVDMVTFSASMLLGACQQLPNAVCLAKSAGTYASVLHTLDFRLTLQGHKAGATSLRLDPFLFIAVRAVQSWTGGVNSNVVFYALYAPLFCVPYFGHSLKLVSLRIVHYVGL